MKLTQEQADALLAASKRPGRGAYMYMINASNGLMAQLMAQRKSALGIPQQFPMSDKERMLFEWELLSEETQHKLLGLLEIRKRREQDQREKRAKGRGRAAGVREEKKEQEMTIYKKLLELRPEFEGHSAEELAKDGMACPEELSEELFGERMYCEAEQKTPGVCRNCQRQFLAANLPERGNRR